MSGKGFGIKSFLPRTLLRRSLMILVTPVLLIQVITTFMFFDRHWNKMTTRLAFAAAGEVTTVAGLLEQEDNPQHIQGIIDTVAQHLDLHAVFYEGRGLESADLETKGFSIDSMVAGALRRELENMLRHSFVLDIDFQEKWVEVRVQPKNGVLVVGFPGRRLFSSSGYIFLLWMIGSSLVLLLIAILFMRGQIRPIRKLAIAAERFGKGRDVGVFRPSGAREVRQASQAFIDMHARISRQIEQRTAMLAGVSHDLRTPLTRMKLGLAMLQQTPDTEAMQNDIRHMERMIEGYIDFVRGEGDEQAVHANLYGLVEEAVLTLSAAQVEVDINMPQDFAMMLRPLAFKRCLLNILNNAARYAGHIWIEGTAYEDHLDLSIEDDGPGIPAQHQEDVFRPFFRVDPSRSAETGGVGLGLPIAMDIVHAHGGKIWLEKSAAHGGLRVCIRLPL